MVEVPGNEWVLDCLSGFRMILVPILRIRATPPLTSHRSQRTASFLRSLPRPSKPLIHSSAVAEPIALTSSNSRLISSMWGLKKCFAIWIPVGCPFWRVAAGMTWSSLVRKINGRAVIRGEGIEDDRSKSISYTEIRGGRSKKI